MGNGRLGCIGPSFGRAAAARRPVGKTTGDGDKVAFDAASGLFFPGQPLYPLKKTRNAQGDDGVTRFAISTVSAAVFGAAVFLAAHSAAAQTPAPKTPAAQIQAAESSAAEPSVAAASGSVEAAAAADAAGQAARFEALREAIDKTRGMIAGSDRAARIAAYETARRSGEDALRRAAVDAALESRDPTLAALVVRDWLARTTLAPVLLYAVREEQGSPAYLQNLGPLTFRPTSFDPATGAVTAQLSAPGYDMTRDAVAAGTLAGATLTVNTFGCQLALQLTGHRTLDGLYRCRTLPTLVARIVLD